MKRIEYRVEFTVIFFCRHHSLNPYTFFLLESVLRHFIIPVKLESSVLIIQVSCISVYIYVCVQFNRVCFVANLPNHLYGD